MYEQCCVHTPFPSTTTSPPLPVKPVSVFNKYGPCGAILWPNGTLYYLTDSNDLGYLLDCCGLTTNDCRFVMDKPKEGGGSSVAMAQADVFEKSVIEN